MFAESVVLHLMDVVQTVTSPATIVLFLQDNANTSFICSYPSLNNSYGRHCIEKWLHTPDSKSQCPMDRQPWGISFPKLWLIPLVTSKKWFSRRDDGYGTGTVFALLRWLGIMIPPVIAYIGDNEMSFDEPSYATMTLICAVMLLLQYMFSTSQISASHGTAYVWLFKCRSGSVGWDCPVNIWIVFEYRFWRNAVAINRAAFDLTPTNSKATEFKRYETSIRHAIRNRTWPGCPLCPLLHSGRVSGDGPSQRSVQSCAWP